VRFTHDELQTIAKWFGWRELVYVNNEWLCGEHSQPDGRYKEFRTLTDDELFGILDDKCVESGYLPKLETTIGCRWYWLFVPGGTNIIGEGKTRLTAVMCAVLDLLETMSK